MCTNIKWWMWVYKQDIAYAHKMFKHPYPEAFSLLSFYFNMYINIDTQKDTERGGKLFLPHLLGVADTCNKQRGQLGVRMPERVTAILVLQ